MVYSGVLLWLEVYLIFLLGRLMKVPTLRKEIELRDIRSVYIDNSIAELAVKKGALIGLGITSVIFLSNYRAIKEFFNFSKVFRTGVIAYRQGVGFIPLTSVSYVIYDYFRGYREIIINPLDVKN